MPSSLRKSSRALRSATESAPPEQATATRSPGRSNRCSRINFSTFSIRNCDADLHYCGIIEDLMYRKPPSMFRRTVYSFVLGFVVFLLGVGLRTMLDKLNVGGFIAIVDDIMTAILAGLLVFFYERHQHKAMLERMR